MAEPARGMGRGLGALFGVPSDGEGERELRHVPVELISPNPRQPRRHFDEDTLVSLAGSMTERGILQPVLVRPVAGGTFELIAGERRWRAAKLAGLDTIPALVRPQDDAASLEIALIENMAREDLSPVEEARACALLVEELGLTQDAVGKRVGKSRVAVSNLLRLLDLPEEALTLLSEGRLTEGHGRAILMAPDHDDRRRLARAAAAEGWSVRETEARARAAANRGARGTIHATRRASLHPDQEAAAERLGEALGRALGTDVKVKPKGNGYSVSLAFASLDEALEVAARLGAVEPA